MAHKFPHLTSLAASAVLVTALSACSGDGSNPFKSDSVDGKAASAAAEGKCGEGKCGGAKKAAEGKCGEGKCGEGKCGAGK